ncbi:MAG: PriCT-2 domain-containing protein [Cellvibrionaceae bacterium]
MSEFERCTLGDVANALSVLDYGDQDVWVKMGMAIKNEFGEDGFDTWAQWSSAYEKYKPSEARSRWRSFKVSGARGTITIATLFQAALERGWTKERKEYTDQEKREWAAELGRRQQQREKDAAEEKAAIERGYTVIASAAKDIWGMLKQVGKAKYLGKKSIKPLGAAFVPHGIVIRYVTEKRKMFEEVVRIDVITGRDSISDFYSNKSADEKFLYLKPGVLVVPVLNQSWSLVNLQIIYEGGAKKFMKGGRKSGCFFLIGDIDPNDFSTPIVEVEGYATGASAHMATGWPVVVAWDAGNLASIARFIRAAYPSHLILVAGDNDAGTDGNPGKVKAKEAADAIGGIDVIPNFDALAAGELDGSVEVVNG